MFNTAPLYRTSENNSYPRLEHHQLGLLQGTIRATVLIETLPAAFEMDEILYELREHIAGLTAVLNCSSRLSALSAFQILR